MAFEIGDADTGRCSISAGGSMSGPSKSIFASYTQAELDAAYSQREWADNMESLLTRWASVASDIRARTIGYEEVRYGAGQLEFLDLYPAVGIARFAHFHVHGAASRRATAHSWLL